jgi:hypothetical protein
VFEPPSGLGYLEVPLLLFNTYNFGVYEKHLARSYIAYEVLKDQHQSPSERHLEVIPQCWGVAISEDRALW